MGTPGVMRMRSVSLEGATYLSVPSQLIFSTEIMPPFSDYSVFYTFNKDSGFEILYGNKMLFREAFVIRAW